MTFDTFFLFSFENPSGLAAALQQDPEEFLYSLGFCAETSVLHLIPSRFFQQPSAAHGIDVEEIHNTLLLDYAEVVLVIFQMA